MNFGEKLKQLRKDNGLTQDALAEKIFVTRTAISKWETNAALPAIDNLKMISNLFHVSIDDLISDGDIETKRLLDEKRSKIMYFVSLCFLALATAFTLLSFFLKNPYLNIGGALSAIPYVVFGILSKPRYKRLSARKIILPYVLSRAVILLLVIGLAMIAISKL